LCAGFVLVLAGGIALLFGLKSEAEPQRSPVVAEAPRNDPPPEAPKPAARADEPAAKPLFPVIKPRPPSQIPTIAVDVPKPPEDEVQYRPDGVPIAVADLDVLRDAASGVDYPVLDCVNKHGGKAVTGQVITTYLVSRKKEKDGKYTTVVEQSGFEEDGTTITDPALVECMHKTAFQMKFPASNSPVATWVRRRITVEAGRLGDNWVFQHGYIK
jgi:hypothetical protein